VRYLVTGPLPDDARSGLPEGDHWENASPEPISREKLRDLIADTEGLLCMLVDQIDREILTIATRLRVVSQVAVGVDNIDMATCTAREIPVGHTPGVLTETTADSALALLLSAVRRVPEGHDLVRAGEWQRWSLDLLVGEDLHGTIVGIIGLGRIGVAIARRLGGFGVRLLYTGPHRKPDLESQLRIGYRTLEELLKQSDHVIISAPLNDSTRTLIDRTSLALMKPSSTLVNISRGGLVDHLALADALRTGVIARAALDVTDPEPIPVDHPLVALPNCLIIPHLGSASARTRIMMGKRAVENLVAGLEGRRLPWCANPEVYES
jgi:glyoxylate reductase